jgi:rRNA maturation endonuclease Nob1
MSKIGWISCADCGKDLDFDSDEPCPECGSNNRIIRTDNE